MSNSGTVKGTKRHTSANSPTNAIAFLVEQVVREMINTAEVVHIQEADQPGENGPAGFANALPLVTQTDGWGNAVRPAMLFRLPWFRYQSGDAAFIVDPQPGDKALAIAPKRDSSGVTTDTGAPVKPASFREYDTAGSFLIGGFQNKTPKKWIRIDPVSGEISISTPSANVIIECRESGDIVVRTGSGNIAVQTGAGHVSVQAGSDGGGTITLDGQVVVTRTIKVQNKRGEAASQFQGGFDNTGGNVTSNGVTLETHTHSDVEPGGGNTGSPNAGT